MAHAGLLPTPSIPLQASVIAAAHAHNLITLAHALSLNDTLAVLEAGTDGLAHCFCDEEPTQALVSAYKKHNTFLIPTLIVVATLTGEEVCAIPKCYFHTHADLCVCESKSEKLILTLIQTDSSEVFVKGDMAQKHLGNEEKSCFCDRMMMGKKDCKVDYAYKTVKLLKENGLDIVA